MVFPLKLTSFFRLANGLIFLGQLRNLWIRSEDGGGYAGLAMTRPNSGPYLVKNTRISGFRYGVIVCNSWCSHLFEHLWLEDIGVCVVRVQRPPNDQAPQGPLVAIRRLTASRTAFPVVRAEDPSSMVTLAEARIEAPENAGETPALSLGGDALVLQAESSRPVLFIECMGAKVRGDAVGQFVSRPPLGDGDPEQAWQLPVEETPFYNDTDFGNWANVMAFGADPSGEGDDTAAIQAALDSGKSTVYFPAVGGGEDFYLVTRPLLVPATVERIVGFNSRLRPERNDPRFYGLSARPMLVVRENSDKPLFIEGLKMALFWHFGEFLSLQHSSPRALVLRNSHVERFAATSGAGDLFLESVIGAEFQFAPYQSVWARHLNPEGRADKVLNNAGRFWCFGLKGEQASAMLVTVAGGRTELLGGLFTASLPVPEEIAGFSLLDSSNSLNFICKSMSDRQRFRLLIEEARGGERRLLKAEDGYRRPWKKIRCHRPFIRQQARAGTARVARRPAETPPRRGRQTRRGDAPALRRHLRARRRHGPGRDAPGTRRATPPFGHRARRAARAEESGRGGAAAGAGRPRAAPGPLHRVGRRGRGVRARVPGPRQHPRRRSARAALEGGARALSRRRVFGQFRRQRARGAMGGPFEAKAHGGFFRTNRRPKWEIEPATGKPAIRFDDHTLNVQKSGPLMGQPFPEKTLHFAFKTGADIQTRQVLYKQGAARRGICVYLHGGKIFAGAWNLAQDPSQPSWGPTFVSAPVLPDAENSDTWVLRGKDGTMELFVNGKLAGRSEGAGVLYPHSGGTAYFGLQLDEFPMHDTASMTKEEIFINSRGGYPFRGHIFRHLHYNRALGAEEVSALHQP